MQLPITFLAATMAISSAVAFATSKNDQYLINYYKDCTLIKSVAMDQAQQQAYKNLHSNSATIEQLSREVDAIQPEIEQYTRKINTLTKKAFVEDSQQLLINKQYMAEQEKTVDEFEKFMHVQQHKFDQLEVQANKVEAAAAKFEALVGKQLNRTKYDQVQIISPEENSRFHCYTS